MMTPVLFLLGLVGGLVTLVIWGGKWSTRRASESAAQAAQALGFARVELPAEQAARALCVERDELLSPPELYTGHLDGLRVAVAKVQIPSRMAINGGRVPLVGTRIVAELSQPLAFELWVYRRVFGMQAGQAKLSPRFEKACVIECSDPAAAQTLLSPMALQDLLIDVTRDGLGLTHVMHTHLESMVMHPDPPRIVAQARALARAARALGERQAALAQSLR